jgi:hypothetical protein
MANLDSDYIRPLCPVHYNAMALTLDMDNAESAVLEGPESIDVHQWECSVEGRPQNYSLDLGYLTIGRNDDHWGGTGSSSIWIRRSATQVICGEHKDSMFLQSFDAKANLENFRCPRKTCQHTMRILAGGPPTYWLGEGYFRAR